MKDAEQYYSNYSDLKEDYPHFALELIKYIDSLHERWFFNECFNPDCDGSRFAVVLHNGGKALKNISAVKTGAAYTFEENQ